MRFSYLVSFVNLNAMMGHLPKGYLEYFKKIAWNIDVGVSKGILTIMSLDETSTLK